MGDEASIRIAAGEYDQVAATAAAPGKALPKAQATLLRRKRAEASAALLHLGCRDDVLLIAFGPMADPLLPAAAVALSSTCRVVWRAARPTLRALKAWHAGAGALCGKIGSQPQARHLPIECSPAGLKKAEALCFKNGAALTPADAATLGHLIECGSFSGLGSLDLDNTRLDRAGVRTVVQGIAGGTLPRLRSINFGNHEVGDAVLVALASSLGADPTNVLPWLTELHLYGTSVGDEGVCELLTAATVGALPRLELLSLDGNKGVRSRSAVTLVDACAQGALPRLRDLKLAWTSIDDVAVAVMAKAGASGGFARLEGLHVEGNDGITLEGVDALAAALEAGAFPALMHLSLPGKHQGRPDMLALRKARDGFYC